MLLNGPLKRGAEGAQFVEASVRQYYVFASPVQLFWLSGKHIIYTLRRREFCLLHDSHAVKAYNTFVMVPPCVLITVLVKAAPRD